MRKLILLTLCALLIGVSIVPAAAQDDDPLWWNDRVFYEIFVRSFYDSDGDGIGDLQGVIAQLDYLEALGVGGLWLMPIMPSPSYHGYDVTDYRGINPDYGTMDDFRQLLDEANARNIAVIIDLVVNHSAVTHPWFVASARGDEYYAEWYRWEDEQPNYRGPQRQQVWHPRGGRYYYGIFWDGMPDLNYEHPPVTAEMYAIARYWLEDVGVDGFRLDGYKHIIEEGSDQENTASTRDWVQNFQRYVNIVDPAALLVGEVWSNSFSAAPYVGAGADVVFEFDLANAMLESAMRGTNTAVAALQQRVIDLYQGDQYAAFLTNHDQNRVMSHLSGNIDQARVAASLLLTQPGVPFIYYGEEIGMIGVKPDERIRTPMQWDTTPNTAGFTEGRVWQPLQNDYDEVNVAAQIDDPDSLLSHYRALIELRNDHAALRRGAYVPVPNSDRALYSFIRQTEDQTVLVLINLSRNEVSDYTLTLDQAFVGLDAVSAFGADVDAMISAAEYTPITSLAPFSTHVIVLGGSE